MAKVYLGDWGTYYRFSGTSTPANETYGVDWQNRWNIQYEQNLSTGVTTVYVQPYLKVVSSGGVSLNVTASISTTINGSTKTQSITKTSAGYSPGTTYHYGSTQTFTITHANDGTAQCKFSGYMSGSTSGSYKKTASHTWDLPSINMSSSITNNTSSTSRIVFGSNVAFTITRPNDSITHTLTYAVNGTTYTIGSSIGTSTSYAFPTSLINSYPSNTDVAITVTCTSSNGTVSQTIVYLQVPSSYVPTVSLTISDVGTVPSGWGIYVKTKSKIKGVITASGTGGATIKSYSASANGQTFSTKEFTTSELSSSGTLNISAKATDTRGRVTEANKSITVYDYSAPTYVKVEVVRCSSDGTENNDGTYGKIVCQYSISPCNNKNSKSLIVTYGSTTKIFTLSSYSGTVTATSSQLFSGLDTTANHTFTFKLIDSFSEISQSYIMPPSFVLVSKLIGGKGISLGQIATEEGFHSHLDSFFHKKLYVDGILIDGSNGIESGSNENGNWIKFNDGTLICQKRIRVGYSSINVSLWAGNIYFADIQNGDWAQEFIQIDNVQATNNTDQYWLVTTGYTETSAGYTRLLRPNNGDEWVGADIHLMAIGKWK